MTLGTTLSSVTVDGNGVTTTFSYPFLIPAASDAVVTYTGTSGAATVLAASQYAITGTGSETGGTVTYPLSGGTPIAAGAFLTIARELPLIQPVSVSNQGPTFAAIEAEFDYLTMLIQQVSQLVTLALTGNIADPPGLIYEAPPVAQRALQVAAWDSAGNFIAAQPTSTLVSSAMQPVVAAATTDAAIELLGVSAAMLPVVKAATLSGAVALLGTPAIFNTISALRATTATLPTAVWVEGFATGADGGEGAFWYNAADTTSSDNGGTIIVDAINRRWYRETGGAPINVRWFGMLPGVANCATAMLAALAAGSAVHIPAGLYTFTAGVTFTLASATAAVSITGDGPELTQLSFSANQGLQINLVGPNNSFRIRDLSVLGQTTNSGIAISINQTNASITNPAETQLSDITNVTIRGADGLDQAHCWGNGILIQGASCINFVNVFVTGASTPAGNGVVLQGTASVIPVLFNFTGCVFNDLAVGIIYGNYVQGVTVSQCNFTFCNFGIYSPSGQLDLAQLAVTASQFNCYLYAIDMQSNAPGTSIAGNFFIPVNGNGCILLQQAGGFNIVGNTFFGLGTTGTTGIIIQTSTSYGIITGNFFITCAVAGINLLASSSNVNVQSNVYQFCGTNVINSGTGNVVGGGSP